MLIDASELARHRQSLDVATAVVAGIAPDDLGRPTPCAGWDLRALLAHMAGQNDGFADSLEGPDDVPAGAFAPVRVGDGELRAAWERSAKRVGEAFATSPGERPVLLAEISTEHRFPASTVLGFHLLDTVVHTWDMATTLGRDFRPDDELAAVIARQAAAVPDGPARAQPGTAFAPGLAVPAGADPWTTALALLGRHG
jgi:uncharacterized protein (TIGR03086 family)